MFFKSISFKTYMTRSPLPGLLRGPLRGLLQGPLQGPISAQVSSTLPNVVDFESKFRYD